MRKVLICAVVMGVWLGRGFAEDREIDVSQNSEASQNSGRVDRISRNYQEIEEIESQMLLKETRARNISANSKPSTSNSEDKELVLGKVSREWTYLLAEFTAKVEAAAKEKCAKDPKSVACSLKDEDFSGYAETMFETDSLVLMPRSIFQVAKK